MNASLAEFEAWVAPFERTGMYHDPDGGHRFTMGALVPDIIPGRTIEVRFHFAEARPNDLEAGRTGGSYYMRSMYFEFPSEYFENILESAERRFGPATSSADPVVSNGFGAEFVSHKRHWHDPDISVMVMRFSGKLDTGQYGMIDRKAAPDQISTLEVSL